MINNFFFLNSIEQYRNFIAGEVQLLKIRCANATEDEQLSLIRELGLLDYVYKPKDDASWKGLAQSIAQQEQSDPSMQFRTTELTPEEYFIVYY